MLETHGLPRGVQTASEDAHGSDSRFPASSRDCTSVSLFVIWVDVSLECCHAEDIAWVRDLLGRNNWDSLQRISGVSPEKLESATALSHFLEIYDFGRLVTLSLDVIQDVRAKSIRNEAIRRLELSERPSNALARAGIENIGQLLSHSEASLLRMRNMGRKSVLEIQEKLASLGQQLNVQLASTDMNTRQGLLAVWFVGLGEIGMEQPTLGRLLASGFRWVIEIVVLGPVKLREKAALAVSDIQAIEEWLQAWGLNWSPDSEPWLLAHAAEIHDTFRRSIEAWQEPTRPQLSPVPLALTIEEEFEALFSRSASTRNIEIAREYLGWDGGAGSTLEALGTKYALTRERVRQIIDQAIKQSPSLDDLDIYNSINRYVGRSPVALAGFVEAELKDARLSSGVIRLEGLAATTRHFGWKLDWWIERRNEARLVLTEEGEKLLRTVDATARRLMSNGAARATTITAGLQGRYPEDCIRLAIELSQGLRWLDPERQWFTMDAVRNRVLSRLQKILTWAPQIEVEQAREAVLRDRQMCDVDLPEQVFHALCQAQPWCSVEGHLLHRGEPWLIAETDTNEARLAQVLATQGPVMRKDDLWRHARAAGIESISLAALLENSNLVQQHSAEVFGLIGRHWNPQEEAPVKALPTSDNLWLLAQRLVQREGEPDRSRSLVELCLWEELESALNDHWHADLWPGLEVLRNTQQEVNGRVVTGEAAFGLAFIAFAARVGRASLDPESLWPEVFLSMPPGLRTKVFDSNGQLRSETKQAIRSACESFDLRQGLDRGGPEYVRTVQLQYGIGQGWRNVSIHHAPAVISILLDPEDENYSAAFSEFWEVYKRYRGGVKDIDDVLPQLHKNPWVPPGGALDLERFAWGDEGGITSITSRVSRIFESPILCWKNGTPQLRLSFAPELAGLLDGDEWKLMVAGKEYRVQREGDTLIARTASATVPAIEVPLEVSPLFASMGDLTEEIDLFGGQRLLVFRGEAGRLVDIFEPVRSGEVHTLLYNQTNWLWQTSEDAAHFQIGDGWKALRVTVWQGHLLSDGDEAIWPLSWRQAKDDGEVPRLELKCDRGHRWGDSLRVRPAHVPEGFEVAGFRLSGTEYSADAGRNLYVPLSPDLVVSRQTAELICWDSKASRRRILPCDWTGPAMSGFVVSHGGEWLPLKPVSDRRFLLRKKIRRVGAPDQRGEVLNGSERCGRVSLDDEIQLDKLGGWGENLRVCRGPYEIKDAVELVREVTDTGELERIGWDRERKLFRLSFRSRYEPSADHCVEIWGRGHHSPIKLPIAGSEDFHWWVELPEGMLAYGAAVFLGSVRIGSRWKELGLLAETIRQVSDWPRCFDSLLRWKAPLLHGTLAPQVLQRCAGDPVPSLKALFVAACSGTIRGDIGFLMREIFQDLPASAIQAAGVLRGAGILPQTPAEVFLDPDSFRTAIALAPLITAALAVRGAGEICRSAGPDLARYVSRLRFEALQGWVTLTESDRRWVTIALDKAVSETGRDPNFLKSLLPDSRGKSVQEKLLMLRYYENSPAFGRWLAASMLHQYWVAVESGVQRDTH